MGRIGNWFKNTFRKIGSGIKKAVKWVGEKVLPKIPAIGGVVKGITKAIPHPLAKTVEGITDKVVSGAGVAKDVYDNHLKQHM